MMGCTAAKCHTLSQGDREGVKNWQKHCHVFCECPHGKTQLDISMYCKPNCGAFIEVCCTELTYKNVSTFQPLEILLHGQ
jgi:hypothetical protein